MELRLRELLDLSAALHDHLCPRQILGVRMGMHAGELLGLDLPQSKKRLLTFVETDGCFADGVSAATGCWLGRRTLRLVDYGKVAATFIDTRTERAVRMCPSAQSRALASQYAPEAKSRWHAYLTAYQVMPTEKLLVAQFVTLIDSVVDIVSRPGLRAMCDMCGEEILNAREVVAEERILCRSCSGASYYRMDATHR